MPLALEKPCARRKCPFITYGGLLKITVFLLKSNSNAAVFVFASSLDVPPETAVSGSSEARIFFLDHTREFF